MDQIYAGLISQLLLTCLQAWIHAKQLEGKTQDEIRALFETELLKFYQNRPETLPDV